MDRRHRHRLSPTLALTFIVALTIIPLGCGLQDQPTRPASTGGADGGGGDGDGGTNGGGVVTTYRDVNGDGLYHHVAGCEVCHVFHGPPTNLSFVRETIDTPSSGERAVVFTGRTGAHSFADGDDVYDGVCEVCHTVTAHHRNGPGGDHAHYAGTDCTVCHPHAQEFTPQVDSSHIVHTAGTARGLALTCDGCHNDDATVFNDGRPFATTTVCDGCHSPGGIIDGVDDPVVGARTNWSSGIYRGDELAPGKERWCAGCHDLGSSVIRGVAAPAVAGDGSYGFYATGHGRGGQVTCTDCHDTTLEHCDGTAHSYSAAADNFRSAYRLAMVNGVVPLLVPRTGWDWDSPYDDPPYFALCFSCHDKYALLGGPTAPPGPYHTAEFHTNFRNDASVIIDDGLGTDIAPYSIPGAEAANSHATHLGGPPHFYDSDGDGTVDSYGSCVACHNVHGSTAPAMIRDGRLHGPVPGLNFSYVRYDRHDSSLGGCADPIVMTSAGVTAAQSVGGVMRAGSGSDANGVCSFCHCSGGATGDPEYIINCYDPDCVDYYRVYVTPPVPAQKR